MIFLLSFIFFVVGKIYNIKYEDSISIPRCIDNSILHININCTTPISLELISEDTSLNQWKNTYIKEKYESSEKINILLYVYAFSDTICDIKLYEKWKSSRYSTIIEIIVIGCILQTIVILLTIACTLYIKRKKQIHVDIIDIGRYK